MNRRNFLGSFRVLTPLLRAADRVERTETIERTFPTGGPGEVRVLVDNIHGGIRVTGDSERSVRLKVNRRTQARSEDKIAVAQQEVRLDMNQQGNEVRLYVDGPFRTPHGVNERGWDYNGYEVSFDYELRVPHDSQLVLKTVNRGSVEVENVRGEFKVRNVNGPISMKRMAGGGSVETVNGAVKVEMDAPAMATSFRTLNGPLEVRLPATLSANLNIKNRWHGEIYTDFDVVPLPPPPARIEHADGRTRYRMNEFAPFRVRQGGPELTFETFNGTIRILSQTR